MDATARPRRWPGALQGAWSPLELEEHFIPLRCPDERCSFLVCGHCNTGGMTRQHVSWDGRCSYGHLASDPASVPALVADLETRLTDWIKAEGIEGNYPPDQIASRVVASIHRSYLEAWLSQGGTDYLRHACRHIKDSADQTDAEHAAESYLYGHGSH